MARSFLVLAIDTKAPFHFSAHGLQSINCIPLEEIDTVGLILDHCHSKLTFLSSLPQIFPPDILLIQLLISKLPLLNSH